MDLFGIYGSVEQFSNKTLTTIFIKTEYPLGNFLNDIFSRLPDWTFLLLATVIGAIVAVKVEKYFKGNERIHDKKLMKIAISESFTWVWTFFIYGILLFLIALAFLYGFVKSGMKYSSTLTLSTLILALSLILLLKKYKNNKKIAPLRRFREQKRSRS